MLLELLPEILEQVLSFCSSSDLKNLSSTCHRCNGITRPYLYRTLNIPRRAVQREHTLDDKMDYMIQHTRALSFIDDSGFSSLHSVIPVHTFIDINSLINLEELNVSNSRNTNDIILRGVCSHLSKLRILDVSQSKVTNTGMASLLELKHLWKLNVANCAYVTDDGLGSIAKLTQLTSLKISRANLQIVSFTKRRSLKGFTEKGLLLVLKELVNLQDLDLSALKIAISVLPSIAALQKLTCLNLSCCTGLDDAGLSTLSTTQLVILRLRKCLGITDIGVNHLAKNLSTLRSLDLHGTRMSGRGIKSLRSFPMLEVDWSTQ